MYITHIKNYILYLRRECGLNVSLHVNGIDSVILTGELSVFNIHDNSYCAFIKSCPKANFHCVEKQDAVAEKCKAGSFSGVCHAGVFEYVYPIISQNKTVGFISVGGYKCNNSDSYINAMHKKYGLKKELLAQSYNTLKSDVPGKTFIDTLIMPLQDMLELAYTKHKSDNSTDLIDRVLCYIKKFHTQNITTKDICKYFSCSRSLISHRFNERTGMGIKQYINSLRAENAKNLLENSSLSVTEIAFSLGFSSPNYFTQIFKSNTGMSPASYKQNARKKHSKV